MIQSPHILIVDDDRELRQLLTAFLARHEFRVAAAADGRAMDKLLETARFDLIVLDLMLPGKDGLALCRQLRTTSNLPIIMLTALAEEIDRIVGLEMGADDYVVKPFNPRELLARIKAVLRRTGSASSLAQYGGKTLVFEGWRLDISKRELHSPEGVLMSLTGGEFDLLVAFAERPQRILNRDQLLDLTRGRVASAYDRSIDVQLSRLRRKIEADPNEPVLIKTVRGGGYLFLPSVVHES
jgi:two-component system, OmpR family, response regulator